MGGRWALLLGLLWLGTGAPIKADPLARQRLHDCAQRASPQLRGIEALRADCPEIGADLGDLGVTTLLPEDWKARISPRAVADLTVLADRYTQPSVHVAPGAPRLQAIARNLQAPATSVTWWQRLRSWIASWLGSDRNRWPDWLRSLTHWHAAMLLLLYGCMALLVAGVVAVLIIELRAAGLMGAKRRPGLPRQSVMEATDDGAPDFSLADVEAAPVSLRPAILLRLLVTALASAGRLERDSIMTCRELITAARFDNTGQRQTFARIALLAEQVLYGDPRHAPASTDPDLLGSAGGLYRELVGVPAQPTTP